MARARLRLGIAVAVILCGAALPGRAAPPLPQPSWKQLNAEQRRILAPLAGEWDKMEGFRRKKWLGIAQRYQTLSPEEQARMQKRMTAWAKLTPEERKQARDKYLQLQKAPPEKKETVKQKWEAYKELPDAEKERLKAEAARKTPARPVPKPGPAAKPSPAAKPAPTPPATPAAPQTPAPAEPASDQAGGSGTR